MKPKFMEAARTPGSGDRPFFTSRFEIYTLVFSDIMFGVPRIYVRQTKTEVASLLSLTRPARVILRHCALSLQLSS